MSAQNRPGGLLKNPGRQLLLSLDKVLDLTAIRFSLGPIPKLIDYYLDSKLTELLSDYVE